MLIIMYGGQPGRGGGGGWGDYVWVELTDV